MNLALRAHNTVSWSRPTGIPSGFQTGNVFTCQRGTSVSAPMEIATARFTGPDQPGRPALVRLHTLRVNQRVTPVVLAVEIANGQVMIFGPNPDVAPTQPLSGGQAERLLQAVLDEPNPVAARSRLAGLVQALNSTSIPGIKNSGLFANHELRHGVPQRTDWRSSCEKSDRMLRLRDHDLIEALGYSIRGTGAHALVLSGAGPRPEAIAVMLNESEGFDADSQRFSISPVAYGLKMAEQTGVSWLILVRGGQLRLYPARIDLGVGRKGLAETYFEVDLPQLTEDSAGYLALIFASTALVDGGSAFQIMTTSAQYAVALGARLRDQVYEEIVPQLSVAVAERLVDQGRPMDAEGLDLAYQLTLRIFFRMLFQVYAEDRHLLPFGQNARYDRSALKTVARDLIEDPGEVFDAESTSMWDDLTKVWHVIDKGDRDWGVPAYNGGLFAADLELNEHGALIEELHITNDVMGPCLKALLIDQSAEGEVGPIDFRSLSVREFGTIYEGLLESNLSVADVDLTLDANGTWLPAKKGDDVVARAGTVYFHNTSGQRKGTGSYYTPTFVVEHLLERSLDPALDDHLGNVAKLLKAGDQAGAAELFFDFRVADLAMGSGHFLTAAIDHIEGKMAAFLEEEGHQIPGVAKEIIVLGHAARDAMGDPEGTIPEGSSLLRRQIARRCIYGLDINPISVELARVAIWIHTFVRGLPMSSLDHNLVCANSLTGIGTIDEALDVLVPNRKGVMTLFDAPIADALGAASKVLAEVALLSEVNRSETQAASRAVKKAKTEAETARLIFDAAVLHRIGEGNLIEGHFPSEIAAETAKPNAQMVLAPLLCGHMPVLFPEVFLRSNGGFDVLIGNPPWEELMVEEPKFWLRVSPGLLGLRPAEMKARIADLRASRPDLVEILDRDIEVNAQVRKVLMSGPFPGLGTGDVDLYQVFAWRNWQLVRTGGRIGAVFPRSLLNSAGCASWRDVVLDQSAISVVTLINTSGWVFPSVHGQYSIALVDLKKGGEGSSEVSLGGPFHDSANFAKGRTRMGHLPIDLLRAAASGAAFPQLPTAESAAIFVQIRRSPRLDDPVLEFAFRPVAEFHATNDRAIFDAGGEAPGRWPVYGGSSFNIWQPDTGERYAWADSDVVTVALQRKRLNQANNRRSAFYGLPTQWVNDPRTLPCHTVRIAFRDVTNATNTRTCIASLLPGELILTNKAPYLLRTAGDESDEAYLLGILCSIPLDWYARRYVELNLNLHIFRGLPIPHLSVNDWRRARIIAISGRLAAKDERFSEWAAAVGVEAGSVREDERESLEAELDALVASAYGLTREQVSHIYATFHRGWNYERRLAAVLSFFDGVEVNHA